MYTLMFELAGFQGVQRNLINELFVALQASHPAQLIERFGFSTE
jgi:hypothetical protein